MLGNSKHLISTLLAFGVFALASGYGLTQENSEPAKGGIYKQVDPEGNVTYTDKPPSADAKAIEVPKGTEYTPPKLPAFTPSPPKLRDTRFEYQSLAIITPKPDEAIWDNTGNVTVTVAHEPFLQPGHNIEFLLDGEPVAKGTAVSHQFINMDRGTHQITARIVDGKDEELISANVTFHMMRHHIRN